MGVAPGAGSPSPRQPVEYKRAEFTGSTPGSDIANPSVTSADNPGALGDSVEQTGHRAVVEDRVDRLGQ